MVDCKVYKIAFYIVLVLLIVACIGYIIQQNRINNLYDYTEFILQQNRETVNSIFEMELKNEIVLNEKSIELLLEISEF